MLHFLNINKYINQYGNGLEDNNCAICIQDYVHDDVYNITNCFHTYHKSCITEWLKRKKSCPLCKHNISFIATDKIYSNKKDFTKTVKISKLMYTINNTYNDQIVVTDDIIDTITIILKEKIYKTFTNEITHNFFDFIYGKLIRRMSPEFSQGIISNKLKLDTDVEILLIKIANTFLNIINIIRNKPYLITYVSAKLVQEKLFHLFIYENSDTIQFLNLYQIITIIKNKNFDNELLLPFKIFRFKLIETLDDVYKMNPVKFIKSFDSYENFDVYKKDIKKKETFNWMLENFYFKYHKYGKTSMRDSHLINIFKIIGNNIELFLDYFKDIINHKYFWNIFKSINNIEVIDRFLKIDPKLINGIKYDLLTNKSFIKYLIKNFDLIYIMNEYLLDKLLTSLLEFNEIKQLNNNTNNTNVNLSNYSIDKIIDVLISKNNDISDKKYILSRSYLLLYIIKKYPATLEYKIPIEYITDKIKSFFLKKKSIILEKKINYIINDQNFKDDLNNGLIKYTDLKSRLKYVSDKLINDNDIALKIVVNIIDDIDKILYDHFFSSRKNFILACSKIDGKKVLLFLNKTHNKTFMLDSDIATSAIYQNIDAIKYLYINNPKYHELVLYAIELNPKLIEYIPQRFLL